MDSKLNEYYDDRKRESHRVRKRYFRSHPHLIISPKPRRKRLGRRKWPTQLPTTATTALSACVCVEHSLLLELAKYAIFSKTKPQNKILTNEAEGIANTKYYSAAPPAGVVSISIFLMNLREMTSLPFRSISLSPFKTENNL